MEILVTGSEGFIGKNLLQKLKENKNYSVNCFNRGDELDLLEKLTDSSDIIVHLAGENRPDNVNDFTSGNTYLTKKLCSFIEQSPRKQLVIFTSSIQAEFQNPYGTSKLDAEKSLENLSNNSNNSVVIYRLPGVFGKWCKPNYNSVVATFCHNIANDVPIEIHDPLTKIRLVYIDDVIDSIIDNMNAIKDGLHRCEVLPDFMVTLDNLSKQIEAFKNFRTNLVAEKVGTGFTRALYSTYISYLPLSKFVYDLTKNADERGCFVELLKTPNCGQFSFFTANPGVIRGSHYHHSKTEKFIVVKGSAKFRFKNIVTNESHEFLVSDDSPQVVETIPGWAHNIENIGKSDLIVMLWANEIFDPENPDTIAYEV